VTELEELKQTSPRVLVVDDDTFMHNLMRRILKGFDIEHVETAGDGNAALAALRGGSEPVDLVLCDLQMPGMDGLEFLRHLGLLGCEAGVILISGEDKRILRTAESLAAARHLKVLGSLSKPVSPPKLKHLLDKLAKGRAEAGRTADPPLSEQELRRGLAGDAVELFFQPKLVIADRSFAGVEALARWRLPDGSVIGPNRFIPVAEQHTGLIDQLTARTVERAMDWGAQWLAGGHSIKIAVNVSMACLDRVAFPEELLAAAAAAGMDPADVEIEVTESRLMEDIAAVLEVLTRIRLRGIGLAIDDYGTGFSSMQQLQRIPFTKLKVDRAFVHGAAHDPERRAMLESSVELARKLDLTLVAEGVELAEDWQLLKDLGVDEAQGYFIAKPMPGDELIGWSEALERVERMEGIG